MINLRIACITCIIFLICSTAAFSHSLWITADTYNPKVGDTVTLEIGWGHGPRKKEQLKKNSFKQIYVIRPDGKKTAPAKISDTRFRFKADRAGCYAVGAEINPGFMTKTTTGRVMGKKSGIDNAIDCMNFDIRAKTVIRAGREKCSLIAAVKHPLEIIPLDDPAALKKNDVLRVKVLFNGKAVPSCAIHATHEGFKGKDHEPALSVKTDGGGMARIGLTHAGSWILQVKYEQPYPDKKICDRYMYAASFVLPVK